MARNPILAILGAIGLGLYFSLFLLRLQCCLLINFANRLDPDLARRNVGPDLDPHCLTLCGIQEINFEKKNDFEKYQQTMKKRAWKNTQHAELMPI